MTSTFNAGSKSQPAASATAAFANTEVIEKKVDLEDALSRTRRAVDSTTVNIQVNGIYSLPDAWKNSIGDPAQEALYTYEVQAMGASLKNIRQVPRELTEEEKAEAEAAKAPKGKAPAKDNKKGAPVEEPSAEELERREKEKQEKEEAERKRQEEWDALDEETKFFRTKEDIFKEPCFRFNNQEAVAKIEELTSQMEGTEAEEEKQALKEHIDALQGLRELGLKKVEKVAFELFELEEQFVREGGCWVRFTKLPPPEEEVDPKAKKAAPKKGQPVEEAKPVYGRAWLSFEELRNPGAIESSQRIFLETCPLMLKPPEGSEPGAPLVEQEPEQIDRVFEQNRTYISLKVTLSDPVIPAVADPPEPLVKEIVPVKQFIRWPFSKDPTDDFCKQITLAVESLAKEYYVTFQEELHAEAAAHKSENELQESFEERKKEFLYEINTQGKYHIMKEKLKKTIVRIVKEHFEKTGSIRGLHKDERDHFYSELYRYLVAQMKKTVKQIVERKQNELHEGILVTKDLSMRERDHAIEKAIGESIVDRYQRLAQENEHLFLDKQQAELYMKKYMAEQEGEGSAMMQMGKFYLRLLKPDKAASFLKDAYSFAIKDQGIALVYAAFLVQLGKSQEATVILRTLSNQEFEEVKVNLLLSIAADLDQDSLLQQKFLAIAQVKRMRALEMVSTPGNLRANPPKSYPPPKAPKEGEEPVADTFGLGFNGKRLNQDQQDEMWMDLTEFLLNESLSGLVAKSLGYIENKETSRAMNLLADSHMQRKNFQEAQSCLQSIISSDPTDLKSNVLLGHAFFLNSQLPEAQQQYLSTIRLANLTGQNFDDKIALQRLALTFINEQKWEDARVMLEKCLANGINTSFALLNLGKALIKLGQEETAVRVLGQANLYDPENGNIWALLTQGLLKQSYIKQENKEGYKVLDWRMPSILPILMEEDDPAIQYKGDMNTYSLLTSAFQTLTEAIKLQADDETLLRDLATEWKLRERFSEAKECLEQAFRARYLKEKNKLKKVEEFLQCFRAGEGEENEESLLNKFKEILCRRGLARENDDLVLELVNLHVQS